MFMASDNNNHETKGNTMKIAATEHATHSEAIQHLNFADDYAVSLNGKIYTIPQASMDSLHAAGMQPTTWHDRHGKLVSVPGNMD